MTETSATRLLHLATARRDRLLRVHRIGLGQLDLIEQGDMGRLLGLLAEKSRELDSLKEIDAQLKPYRHGEQISLDWPSQEQQSECRQVLQQSEELIKAIVTQEQQSETRLQSKKNDIASQLKTVQGANVASAAYHQHAPTGASQLDLSSGS